LPLVAIAFGLRSFDLSKPTVTNWALVVLTALYVIVSTLQWLAMRKALTETRRANNLTLRPWLIAENIEAPRLPWNEYTFPSLTIRNAGRLPAVDILVAATYYIGTPPTSWPPAMPPGEGEARLLLAAGNPTRFTMPGLTLSDEELGHVGTGAFVLILISRLIYTDALDTRGETIQCALYVPNLGRFVFAPRGNSVR
jgi:hypothetical protein